MSAPSPGGGDIFDVKRIRRLVELMNEHDLSEVDLRQGEQRIKLRKGHDPIVSVGGGVPPMNMPVAAAASPAPAPAPTAAAADDPNLAVVKSPMVGTFYAAASPDAQPFVKVGDPVGPTTTVCVIEAMKVFNEIPAEISGRIVAVLVENGDPVEFGQPLFKVESKK
jgi:acetyl-CoA carboxylase biotin carboxyl carrier protein